MEEIITKTKMIFNPATFLRQKSKCSRWRRESTVHVKSVLVSADRDHKVMVEADQDVMIIGAQVKQDLSSGKNHERL
jgi:hypothetical protein